ncbi:hypothetical protein Tco_1357762, partial [Tanacetum coccineum]
ALNILKKGLLVREEAMETSKRRRSKLVYKIQQHSKSSSEGAGITLEVPDEPKDNFDSSSSSLSGSNDEVQDVPSDEENKADENKVDANDSKKQTREEEEPLDAQAGIKQARGEQANVQVSKPASPNTSSYLTLSSGEYKIQSMVDVTIHQEDPAVQRTPLVDTIISLVTKKITSTPTPPTI